MKFIMKSTMKFTFMTIACICFAVFTIAANVHAAEAKSKTLLYISPNDYKYSIRLLHPYYDYWFEQGPMIAPIALDALKVKLGDVGLCTGNETADTVIRIKPYIFYNPQMRVYHSKLVATIFSGGGSVLGSYVGEAQQQGFNSVDMATQSHLKKVYALAMQQLMTKLQDKHMPDGLKGETNRPCSMIGAQEEAKVNFY
jgi:hypothetical protein